MRFPSWSELTQKIGEFEKYLNDKRVEAGNKYQDFKVDHPLVDTMINDAIQFLPPPFGEIAKTIYSTFTGSPQQKSDAVVGYFEYLKSQGEDHYNQIATQLDSIFIHIKDVKEITAKESTLTNIKEILISNGKETNQKIDLLKNEIKRLETKMDMTYKIVQKSYEIGQDSNQRIIELQSQLNLLLDKQGVTTVLIRDKEVEVSAESKKEIESLIHELENLRNQLATQNQKLPPLDIDTELKQGNFYYFAKNYEKAIEHYDRVLKVEPKYVNALMNQSTAFLHLGRYEEVIKCYDEILKIEPTYVYLWKWKGDALFNLGRYEEAIKCYDELLKVKPKDANALKNKKIAEEKLGKKSKLKFWK